MLALSLITASIGKTARYRFVHLMINCVILLMMTGIAAVSKDSLLHSV